VAAWHHPRQRHTSELRTSEWLFGYFSDRRGMVADPNVSPVATSGESGIEDVINSSSATEMPDAFSNPSTLATMTTTCSRQKM